MNYINNRDIGEIIAQRDMGTENKTNIGKISILKIKHLKDIEIFEMNKRKMTMEQLLLNILVLSLEKKVYFEEGFSFPIVDDEGSWKESEEFDEIEQKITNYCAAKKDKNSEYLTKNRALMSYTPISNQKIKDGSNQKIDWLQAINEVENSHRPSIYNLYNSNMLNEKKGKSKYRPFVCEIPGCSKRYTSLYGLKYHEKNGHNKVYDQSKPFKCPIGDCQKRYKNINGLRYHQDHGHNE